MSSIEWPAGLRRVAGRRGMQALGVAALAAGLLLALLPGVWRQPGAYLFGDAGDAIKNYYVLAYYAQYDHGIQFTGMNYPRGEHVNFLDLQPLLAMPLAWARTAGLPVTGQTAIAATNLLLLLALVLAAAVLYLILRRLLLPGWFAAAGALLITFLSPQLLRFQGHMSLGYACIVPVEWWLLLRALGSKQRRGWWLAALGVFNLLAGLLATYHVGIGGLWLLCYALVLGLQGGWRQQARLLGQLVATAVVPLLAFGLWLKLTDPLTDRPRNPWGLLNNNTTFTGLFSPSEAPLKAVWQALFHTDDPNFEGTVYVGVVGLLVLVGSVVLALRYARQRQWQRIGRPVLPAGLRTSLWASALLLVLALAMPFRLPGLQGYVWLLGPLKQFRALGRMAWPFYYVFSAYAAFYLYRLWRYLRQHRAGAFATGWLLPLLLLWGAEAAWRTLPVAANIAGRDSAATLVGERNTYRELLGWNRPPSSFQALLPLPYFELGTDKIDLPGTGESMREAFRASYGLHLPMLQLSGGRSSVGEQLRLTQLLSSPLLPKPLLAHLPSAKPILLLVTPQPLTLAEQRLVALAHRVAGDATVTLYELPVAALAATTQATERQKATQFLPTLPQRGGVASSTGKGVLYLDFAQQAGPAGHLAAGAVAEPKEGFTTLYDGPPPTPADTSRYEASVWVSARTSYGLGNLQVKVYRQGELLTHTIADARLTTEVDGDWVRVAALFRLPPGATRLEVLYENHDLLADDLLIRPLDTDAYWRTPQGELVLNGYRLGR